MKANNTTKRVKTIEEINAQAERLMQANETWYQDAKRVNREPINRKAQIVAAWHNTKIAAKELQNTPETSETMNTETEKGEKAVEVKIKENEEGAIATVFGVPVGYVDTWFNNTFAACYNFGINTRKRLMLPQLNNGNDSYHSFIDKANAVLWLGDMITRYFSEHGINAKIVNA